MCLLDIIRGTRIYETLDKTPKIIKKNYYTKCYKQKILVYKISLTKKKKNPQPQET